MNLFALNGGIIGLPIRIINSAIHSVTNQKMISAMLVWPDSESMDYRSLIAFVDDREFLGFPSSTSLPMMKIPIHAIKFSNPMDICMMASKVAYENKAYVEHIVSDCWKMHFVRSDDFWNESLQSSDTQAFMCCDSPENAEMIVVAFRGTEPFNFRDWFTDIDLSLHSLGKFGMVHRGFMNALGLPITETDGNKTGYFPKEYLGKKKLAYYTLRDELRQLLERNPKAQIVVTGHGLGGALAIVFAAVLANHQESSILNRLKVYTFGQPRVGDEKFGEAMEKELNGTSRRYFRVVYRYDIVPRVPGRWFNFTHFGDCIYFESWYEAKTLRNEPDIHDWNPMYFPFQYINAWLDLFSALSTGIVNGKNYNESLTSIGYRMLGLLIPGVASHSPRDYLNSIRLGEAWECKKVGMQEYK